MARTWRYLLTTLILILPAKAVSAADLWSHPYDAIPTLKARGWSEGDLVSRGCEERDGAAACRYSLLGTADVLAFGEPSNRATTAIMVRCQFDQCSSEMFRAFAVYVMRAANEDTDDVLTMLLASAFAKRLFIADGMAFSAYKQGEEYVFLMKAVN